MTEEGHEVARPVTQDQAEDLRGQVQDLRGVVNELRTARDRGSRAQNPSSTPTTDK